MLPNEVQEIRTDQILRDRGLVRVHTPAEGNVRLVFGTSKKHA